MTESHCEDVLLIVNWMKAQHDLIGRSFLFMYNKALPLKSIGSIDFLQTQMTEYMFWLAISPEVNTIEAVLGLMKNHCT